MRCFFISTDHLVDRDLFRDMEDFRVGMNYVAIVKGITGVVILAFVLMSNHVHFVLAGTCEDVERFINEFKRRHSKYLRIKYGIDKLLKGNVVDLREIPIENESVERAVAYVQMNPVAANICAYPTQYPWGSGNVFFNVTAPKGIRLDSISSRARIRILHSKSNVPGYWLVGEDGYILPSSYVKWENVEKMFRTPGRMDYFLRTSSKARTRLESGERAIQGFKDQTVLLALPDLCRTLFQKESFEELSYNQKVEMLRQLRYRFSSNVHQLARVTHLSYDAAAKLMDSHMD